MEQVKIIITESAYDDLEDIENYISQDSTLIARRFISKIFDKIDQLRNYPTSGKMVPEIRYISIRELLLNRYRIIYRMIDDENILVLRVVHASRMLDLEF